MAATHRRINGVRVPLSPAETAATESEWADNAPGTGAEWLADQAAMAARAKDAAKKIFADSDPDVEYLARALMAEVVLLRKELNILRGWITGFRTEVAAAANLTNFKDRIALNTVALPDRTAPQVRQAMRDEIDAG